MKDSLEISTTVVTDFGYMLWMSEKLLSDAFYKVSYYDKPDRFQ